MKPFSAPFAIEKKIKRYGCYIEVDGVPHEASWTGDWAVFNSLTTEFRGVFAACANSGSFRLMGKQPEGFLPALCLFERWKGWMIKYTKSDETDLTTMLPFVLITPLREKRYIRFLMG
jgi:hypothetical protein